MEMRGRLYASARQDTSRDIDLVTSSKCARGGYPRMFASNDALFIPGAFVFVAPTFRRARVRRQNAHRLQRTRVEERLNRE